MKKILFLIGALACSGAYAEVFTGTITYVFDGISGVVPFSVEEGKEISLKDDFSMTPYTSAIVRGEKKTEIFRQGGDFTIQLRSQGDSNVLTAYSLKLTRLESMNSFSVQKYGIDLPTSRHVENGGHDILTRGVKHTVYDNYNAMVTVLIN